MAHFNTMGDLPPLPPKAHSSYITTPMKITDTTQYSESPLRNQFIQNANPNRYNRVIYDDEDSVNNSKNNIELKELPTINYGNSSTNDLLLSHNERHHHHHHRYPKYHTKKPSNTLGYKLLNFPYFTIIITIIDIAIFILELVKMNELTGSAFQTKPYINPMLGPSSNVQIYLGSRFAPCIHSISGIDSGNLDWPCPNSTTLETQTCTISQLCNSDSNTPRQTWRLLSAMFLHAGFVHIIFNLLLQCTMGLDVERQIGSIRYIIIYIISGVSGNLLGLNFAQDGMSSTGASGALFGIIAVNLLIFILHRDKKTVRHYGILIGVLLFKVVACFVLGLLPGLDNFCHIGGFVSGLLLGLVLLNDPKFVRLDKNYSIDYGYKIQGFGNSISNHMDSIRRRKFAIWIIVRIVALTLLVAWFVGLSLNFTKNGGGHCSWCKYFNCLPVHNWCSQGDLASSISTNTSPNNNKLFK